MSLVDKALKHAKEIFAGQKDRGGKDYFSGHVMWVYNKAKRYGDKYAIVALFHDAVEDHPNKISIKYIRDTYGDEIADAVDAITKRSGEKYEVYLKRVKSNKISRVIKVIDITHNSDLTRIPNPLDDDTARLVKYKNAVKFLK